MNKKVISALLLITFGIWTITANISIQPKNAYAFSSAAIVAAIKIVSQLLQKYNSKISNYTKAARNTLNQYSNWWKKVMKAKGSIERGLSVNDLMNILKSKDPETGALIEDLIKNADQTTRNMRGLISCRKEGNYDVWTKTIFGDDVKRNEFNDIVKNISRWLEEADNCANWSYKPPGSHEAALKGVWHRVPVPPTSSTVKDKSTSEIIEQTQRDAAMIAGPSIDLQSKLPAVSDDPNFASDFFNKTVILDRRTQSAASTVITSALHNKMAQNYKETLRKINYSSSNYNISDGIKDLVKLTHINVQINLAILEELANQNIMTAHNIGYISMKDRDRLLRNYYHYLENHKTLKEIME